MDGPQMRCMKRSELGRSCRQIRVVRVGIHFRRRAGGRACGRAVGTGGRCTFLSCSLRPAAVRAGGRAWDPIPTLPIHMHEEGGGIMHFGRADPDLYTSYDKFNVFVGRNSLFMCACAIRAVHLLLKGALRLGESRVLNFRSFCTTALHTT